VVSEQDELLDRKIISICRDAEYHRGTWLVAVGLKGAAVFRTIADAPNAVQSTVVSGELRFSVRINRYPVRWT
jgi:hypothetical protein